RKSKRKARKPGRYRPAFGFPVLSSSALLKLADWHEAYRSAAQGGKPCGPTKTNPFCPVSNDGKTDRTEATLGSNPTTESPTGTADPRSSGRAAASTTSRRKGGA